MNKKFKHLKSGLLVSVMGCSLLAHAATPPNLIGKTLRGTVLLKESVPPGSKQPVKSHTAVLKLGFDVKTGGLFGKKETYYRMQIKDEATKKISQTFYGHLRMGYDPSNSRFYLVKFYEGASKLPKFTTSSHVGCEVKIYGDKILKNPVDVSVPDFKHPNESELREGQLLMLGKDLYEVVSINFSGPTK